ncbi:hypothetical protein [Bacteroides sedimenti]|uniref:Uncharacterized protein n=1 Tax=Bacteroides sedimenti TaxID=2136147 RepID=A0ABN6Z3T4_9BACE
MKTKFVYSILLIFFLSSFYVGANYEGTKKEHRSVLVFDVDSSSCEKPFFRDSLLIIYYDEDSLLIKNFYKGNYYQNIYFNSDDAFFEKRFVSNLPENIFGIDTILTFSKKDTSFIYKSKRDDFLVTLIDVSLFDGKYSILRDGDNYKTIKQSMVDTTYKEIFFYDKDYRIYKFINTWKNMKCVYNIRKE